MSDAQTAAAIHKACFDRGWSQSDIETHIQKDIALGLFHGTQMAGFILLRCVAEQAEVLTLAVVTARRRQGAGRMLRGAGESAVHKRGAKVVFLEVAEDNPAAMALYRRTGYQAFGRRPAYYRRKGGRVTALNYSKVLTPNYCRE